MCSAVQQRSVHCMSVVIYHFECPKRVIMELYKRITIFAIIYTGVCLAVGPDWSCDFEEDNCGIIDEEGSWTIYNGALKANVSTSSSGDMFIFSIPHTFTLPRGNVSFVYVFGGSDSSMSVKVCREASEHAFTTDGMGSSTTVTEVVPYSCASKMDVEITFIVRRGSVPPLIIVDSIQIYETPYVDPLVTKQPSTESTSTNFLFKAHTPISYTAPYAAIGGGVAATVVVVSIIIILVYRCKCKPKQDPNYGSGLEEIADGEAPPPGYKTTIVAFPEASGCDTLRMNMENDQQGEIENEYSTPRMKRGTMEAEYVNMKTRDNQVVMVTEDIYENMADDAARKHAVTSKEAEYLVVI